MTQDNFQIDSAAVSDRGLSDKRPQNEDSYLELRESGLFAVADGVGGAQAGDVASQMAMEILAEAFINLEESGDAEDRMKAAIAQANSAIFQMSNDLEQLSTMATTIVALHLSGNIATIGHVGDSRLYRFDGQGNLFRETQDHSVVEEEVRAGRLTPEQAAVHPSRNVISRALGADSGVEIDMKTIMFEPETTFLVCTDGITRHIPDEELKRIISTENDASEICRKFKEICYERGAEDNLTAVVVRVSSEYAQPFDTPKESFEADFEEETVASPRRMPLVNSSILSSPPPHGHASGAGSVPADDDFSLEDTFKDSESPETMDSAQTNDEDTFVFPDNDKMNPVRKQKRRIRSTKPSASAEKIAAKSEDSESDSIAGKIIGGLVWLLIGGLLGAGAVYFWLGAQNSPFNGSNMSAQPAARDSGASTFEQRKDRVDLNPAQFIAENVNPQSAEDFYLVGRAYLRQGNFASARTAFNSAKEKLPGAGSDNKALAFEIAQGLTVVESPFSQNTFSRELNLPQAPDGAAPTVDQTNGNDSENTAPAGNSADPGNAPASSDPPAQN